MNEPIISPWTIYFIDTADYLREVSIVFGALSIFISLVIFSALYLDNEDNVWKSKPGRFFLYASVIFSLLGIFVPSADTMYKMLAASYITPANLKTTSNLADKTVDKLLYKITNAVQKKEGQNE